jgi:hypothetical protein
MSSKRRSNKGRSADILLGEPQAMEIESPGLDSTSVELDSRVSEVPSSEPAAILPVQEQVPVRGTASSVQASVPDEELAAALYEEARDAEGGLHEAEASWLLDAEWPPTPEMEMALLEQGLRADVQPHVQAETPITAMEETMEDNDLGDTVVQHKASIPETGSALPPRPSQVFYSGGDVEFIDTMDIQDAGEKVEPLELPDRPLTEAQKQATLDTTNARILQLDQEIDQVYEQVRAEVGENQNITTECFNHLLKARDIIMRRDAAQLAQAEYEIELAQARLKRAASSAKGARRNAWWILAWGFLWGMTFVALLVMLDSSYAEELIDLLNLRSRYIDPQVLLPAMVWGGVGGVVAVWYSLFKHVSLRDFDSNFNFSYLGKPFFGLVLGATVYMVVHLMIVSLGIWPVGLPEGIDESSGPTIAPWIIYLLAWASGFKENRIFGVVDQVMKRLFSSADS